MTIATIIQGCWLGGISLAQRLTVCGIDEARIIEAHLARPQQERDRIFLNAIRKQ